MIVEELKIWALQLMDENFTVELKQLLAGDVRDVGFGVVIRKQMRQWFGHLR